VIISIIGDKDKRVITWLTEKN